MTERTTSVGDEGLDRLNEQFYSANTAAYFGARLNLLMLAASRDHELGQLLVDGVEFQGLTAKTEPRETTDEDRRQHVAFLIADSQALHHHASEALVRLFLAHIGFPTCPWIEVSALRRFDIFKGHVAGLAAETWPPSLDDAIAPVFDGSATSLAADAHDSERAIRRLVQILARSLRDDGNLYNAVKHGMAVIPGEGWMSMTDDQTGLTMLSTHGPSVEYLESEVVDSERIWSGTTRWVSIRQTLYFTKLTILLIEALWTVARWRYTGRPFTGVDLITNEAIEGGLTGAISEPHARTRFTHVVAREPAKPAATQGKPR